MRFPVFSIPFLLLGSSFANAAQESGPAVPTNEIVVSTELIHQLAEEARTNNVEDSTPGGSFERQLRDYKVRLAANAVRENHGNKTLAARSLSISRAYLHRLIRLADPTALCEDDVLEMETT